MDRKTPGELRDHMLGTYQALRVTLALVALLLPIAVIVAGSVQSGQLWIGGSISKSYWITGPHLLFTPRDVFVGGLLAAAACLYAYKGFSTRENVALNLAAIFATIVALVPTSFGAGDEGPRPKVHQTAAVLFFFLIAYVSIRRSRDTLRFLPEPKRPAYARGYFFTGAAMAVSPIVAVILSRVFDREGDERRWIFFVEWLGVWAFAAYWALKTREMRESLLDASVAETTVKRARVPASRPPANALDRAIRVAMDGPATEHPERLVPASAPEA